jgi:hypothetical protein
MILYFKKEINVIMYITKLKKTLIISFGQNFQ